VIQMVKIIKKWEGSCIEVTLLWLGIIQCNLTHQQIPRSHSSALISGVLKAKINACFNRASGKRQKELGQRASGLLSLSSGSEETRGQTAMTVKLCKSFTVQHSPAPESQFSLNANISCTEIFSPTDNFWKNCRSEINFFFQIKKIKRKILKEV